MSTAEEISIKVTIAGRIYPLTVKREEEEGVREAAKKVNETIQSLQENYAVKDIKDLLSMAALQLASESLRKEGGDDSQPVNLEELTQLEERITSYLKDKEG